MKLEYTSGCICDSLSIDGVETVDIPIKEFQSKLQEIFNKTKYKLFNFNDFIVEIIRGSCKRDYFHEISNEDGDLWIEESIINNTKYKHVEICYEDFIFINDKLYDNNLTDAIFSDIVKLISNIQDVAILQSLFMMILESIGEYECSDRPCECCGDFITTYKLEI